MLAVGLVPDDVDIDAVCLDLFECRDLCSAFFAETVASAEGILPNRHAVSSEVILASSTLAGTSDSSDPAAVLATGCRQARGSDRDALS
ncbi:hypothetical protein SDC9_164699 [bioreactor metagenome]|uniref:Uncharacterized protein n=1 Tax=bioreactor metagenome TaxID=1076179 RepID=A0A645FU96_9ZZZZ